MISPTDGIPGVVAPVLTAELLQRIRELNEDYLELLIIEDGRLGRAALLPSRVLDELRKSSSEAKQLLAKTAFSLYSLGFEAQQFWRTALRAAPPLLAERYGSGKSAHLSGSFLELALLHAWHSAVSQPLAARFVYGIPTSLIDCLSRAPLWQLRRIAVEYPDLLMPRWHANPCFWPEMIRFAASGDLRRLHTLQQLGHQLIAIDLQTSTDMRSAVGARQRNLLRQRLRHA